METIIDTTTGPFTVEMGATTQGSQTIARGLSSQAAIELAESKMNLMGGNWKEPYACNGRHFFQMGEYDTVIADNTPYVFINSLPFLATKAPADMKINFVFAWYDLWVGVYFDQKKRTWYVFPIPMFGLKIQLK